MQGAGTYMFRIDDERVIDATRAGSIAHLINHSCEVRIICSCFAYEVWSLSLLWRIFHLPKKKKKTIMIIRCKHSHGTNHINHWDAKSYVTAFAKILMLGTVSWSLLLGLCLGRSTLGIGLLSLITKWGNFT